MKKIGILGLWHLGCVYSACLAEKGFDVVGFDLKKSVTQDLKLGKPPIFEPNLEQIVQSNLGKNLNFTSDPKEAISKKDYVFITLDTPVNSHDLVQLKTFYALVDLVKKYISPKTVLVVSSQVPVGTCRQLQNQLEKMGKGNAVIYFPENLRLGQAIQTFLEPDRIVVGADDKNIDDKNIIENFLKDFNFFNCPVLEMNLESAEMSKHALNSYLALMISFCSEISDLCERGGADALDVMKALKTDQRVSARAPLNPGIGFAGGTLGRDLQTLKTVSKKINYIPKLIRAAYQVNQDRLPILVKKISSILGSLKGKNIGLLGLTYKPNTDTLRRSQSVELAGLLHKLGANIRAIDPAIKDPSLKFLKVYRQYEEFFKDLDAIILMTWWDDFKQIQPQKIGGSMKSKVVFDTRNFLDRELWEKAGFLYVGIGKG